MIYADFECARCALAWSRIKEARLRLGLRHFPVTSAHSRAMEAALAAEAAAEQGKFREMVESLFADRGRLEDPDLWRRAEDLGLDLERFEADRRSDSLRDRVDSNFRAAIRAGVVTTPSFLVDGAIVAGVPDRDTIAEWVAGPDR